MCVCHLLTLHECTAIGSWAKYLGLDTEVPMLRLATKAFGSWAGYEGLGTEVEADDEQS